MTTYKSKYREILEKFRQMIFLVTILILNGQSFFFTYELSDGKKSVLFKSLYFAVKPGLIEYSAHLECVIAII